MVVEVAVSMAVVAVDSMAEAAVSTVVEAACAVVAVASAVVTVEAVTVAVTEVIAVVTVEAASAAAMVVIEAATVAGDVEDVAGDGVTAAVGAGALDGARGLTGRITAITEGGDILTLTMTTTRTILTTRPTRAIPMVRTIAESPDTDPFLMRPTRCRVDPIP